METEVKNLKKNKMLSGTAQLKLDAAKNYVNNAKSYLISDSFDVSILQVSPKHTPSIIDYAPYLIARAVIAVVIVSSIIVVRGGR